MHWRLAGGARFCEWDKARETGGEAEGVISAFDGVRLSMFSLALVGLHFRSVQFHRGNTLRKHRDVSHFAFPRPSPANDIDDDDDDAGRKSAPVSQTLDKVQKF